VRTSGRVQAASDFDVVREIGVALLGGQERGADAAGMLEQSRCSAASGSGSPEAVLLGPEVLFGARGRVPVALGKCAEILGIHWASLLLRIAERSVRAGFGVRLSALGRGSTCTVITEDRYLR
jgi:hypothetical protein